MLLKSSKLRSKEPTQKIKQWLKLRNEAKQHKSDNYCYCKVRRAITIGNALNIIAYFVCISIIFTDLTGRLAHFCNPSVWEVS